MGQHDLDTRPGEPETPADPSDALSRMADGEDFDSEEPSALDSFYGLEVELEDDDRRAA